MKSPIAGYVALTGEIVNIEDAYNLAPDVPYSINRKFDEDSGYRTKSILAVPIRNQKEKIIAVLQLINAKRDFSARLDSYDAVERQVLRLHAAPAGNCAITGRAGRRGAGKQPVVRFHPALV